ncbi:MAG: 3'-5' exonuclease [Anaerolineales bacterium]|nr:3'-5' exonuclease [Anaerolineales bacterium]
MPASSKEPSPQPEFYIVVDIEASGPNPSNYAMLSIGACTLDEPRCTFYVELQPDKDDYLEESMKTNQLSFEALRQEGLPPKIAMQQFASWVQGILPEGARPIFTAFNAPFDWMFINDYFHRYLGQNPFGHSALDIKAFYMGLRGVSWRETAHKNIDSKYIKKKELTHHALSDAMDEADIFQAMLAEAKQKGMQEEEE